MTTPEERGTRRPTALEIATQWARLPPAHLLRARRRDARRLGDRAWTVASGWPACSRAPA
ncbi:hypothetical protein [Kitasatospora sp. NPDC005856]|uniref:hypothetical protein n=1 Tax=Kitasatospora sp. NPDC005856 TaxID=3154566 RepID=UPI00340D3FB2